MNINPSKLDIKAALLACLALLILLSGGLIYTVGQLNNRKAPVAINQQNSAPTITDNLNQVSERQNPVEPQDTNDSFGDFKYTEIKESAISTLALSTSSSLELLNTNRGFFVLLVEDQYSDTGFGLDSDYSYVPRVVYSAPGLWPSCNSVSATTTNYGARITITRSPCEAGAVVTDIDINTEGQVIRTAFYDWNSNINLSLGEKKYRIYDDITKPCPTSEETGHTEWLEYDNDGHVIAEKERPNATIASVIIENSITGVKTRVSPKATVQKCEIGYGDSLQNPSIEKEVTNDGVLIDGSLTPFTKLP